MIEILHKTTGKVVLSVNADQLAGLDLSRSILVAAALSYAELSGANLEAANLAAADLSGAILMNANLAGTTLTGASLERAVLRGANLGGALLTGANLRLADLQGADLRGCNLLGADLTEARLQDVGLQRANLAGACLERATLTGARYDHGTICPRSSLDLSANGAVFENTGLPTGEPKEEQYVRGETLEILASKSSRHLETRTEQGVLVLTIALSQVEGEGVADALRQEMLAAVLLSGSQKVVVDFCNVKYISSVAFRPLLSLRRKLRENNGRMMLCGLSKAVGDVFYTTRLISTSGEVTAPFEMQADVEAALARLAGASPAK